VLSRRSAWIAATLTAIIVVVVVLVLVLPSGGNKTVPTTSAPTSGATTTSGPTTTTPAATTSTTPTTGTGPGLSDPATRARVQAILDEEAKVGFNKTAPADPAGGPLGGLYVNWRAGWNGTSDPAANTNVQETGLSDAQAGVATERHDPLTDLTYLVSLETYQHDTGDNRYASQISTMEPIVYAEFKSYGYYRSWIYFQLIDLAGYDPTQGWDQAAQAFATKLADHFWDPALGAFEDPAHDTLDSEYVAESAAALADAGARFHQPSWSTDAERAATFLVSHLANPQTGLFPLRASVSGSQATITNQQVTVGEEAQLLDSLLTVHDHSHDPGLLDAVVKAVNSLWSPSLGLHDATNLGFFSAVDAGGGNLHNAYKETRQAWLIPMLVHLQSDGGGDQSSRISEMVTVTRDKLWQPGGPGYSYRVAPNFTAYISHEAPGHQANTESYVTTESMGIASETLEGLPIT
jgi:hypothetical protein